jgi:hypothetical protein
MLGLISFMNNKEFFEAVVIQPQQNKINFNNNNNSKKIKSCHVYYNSNATFFNFCFFRTNGNVMLSISFEQNDTNCTIYRLLKCTTKTNLTVLYSLTVINICKKRKYKFDLNLPVAT